MPLHLRIREEKKHTKFNYTGLITVVLIKIKVVK